MPNRKPIARMRAAGNPGGRELPDEPTALEGAPAMPPDGVNEVALRDEAFEHFLRVAAETPGWIQTSDGALLDMCATHYAQWRTLAEQGRLTGDMKIRKAASGEAALVAKMLGQLGFTPVDRARVSAPGKPEKSLAELLLGDDDDDDT